MRALPDHRGGGIRGLANRLGGIAPAAGASIVRSRLFIKYVALFVAVVSLALVANGAFDVYFSYQEQKASLVRIQREQAEAAAGKIGQFVGEIESQVGWTTQLPCRPARLSKTLRRAAALAPGASHHRARRDQLQRPRAVEGVAAGHGSGRQRYRRVQGAELRRGGGAQGLLRPGLFPPQIRALHDAVARRHAARHRRQHRPGQPETHLGRAVEDQIFRARARLRD